MSDLLAPRWHGKTTIRCFAGPLYLGLNKPNKYRHFLNAQSTTSKAIAVNLAIRIEIEENQLLRRDYGDLVTREKWTEKQFVLKTGVIFSAIGAGESSRGFQYRNIRPDYLIADDLYDDACLENPAAVEKINKWFKSTVFSMMANDRPTCKHILGTAMSSYDLMHHYSKDPRWTFKKFQAVKDWDKGIVLWPENPFNTIEKQRNDQKDMGTIIYARELQNEVRDDATAIIKSGDIQYYDGRTIMSKQEAHAMKKRNLLPDVPEYAMWNRGAIDPAEKEKQVNDFTTRVAAVYTSLGNFYVYAAENEKLSFNKNKEACIAFWRRNNLDRLIIETNKGEGLYQEIKRTTSCPIRGKHETIDKIARKVRQSMKFENRKVFISMLIDEKIRTELVHQLITNKPNHDDLSDALINVLELTDKSKTNLG